MAIQQKPINMFNKGLITEQGELTFPEGASVDELNCTLLRDGSRRRRLAIELETGAQESTTTAFINSANSVHSWENAGGTAGLNFICVQAGSVMDFYLDGTATLSANAKSFSINLWEFNRPSGFGASTVAVQTTTIKGKLIVASPEINTFVVEYDEDTDSISTSEIDFRIRDFDWQGDTSEYLTPSSSSAVSVARDYDTKNAGWADTNNGVGSASTNSSLDVYKSGRSGTYPPLTLPWHSAKNSSGNFDLGSFEKLAGTTSLSANGRYIYDLYNINRQDAADLSDSSLNYTETSRFDTVETFAGRVFYSGMSNKNAGNIFFSPILTSSGEGLGDCFQVNDPSGDTPSDLLDTDGGVITIPEAYNITKLHTLGSKLLVFAENGVWSVSGVDDVFRATSYSISKITDAGLKHRGSFVAQDVSRPYWWSTRGIFTIDVSNELGSIRAVNLTLPTIQSFYESISASSKDTVKGAYDPVDNRVFWMYSAEDETVNGKLTRCLTFDETLGAFYPWVIGDSASGPYSLVPFYLSGTGVSDEEFQVVTNTGDTVQSASGANNVVSTVSSRSFLTGAIAVLVRTANSKYTFAKFTGTDFQDWGTESYSSFAEGAYDFVGDMTTKKNTVYITSYLKVTEEDIVDTGSGYTYNRPSSCKVSTYWDFKTSTSQTPQEAYRLKELPTPSGAGSFPYPKTVTVSRIRLRGRGRSFRVRYESNGTNDFHLLGYDVISEKNARL
jgi:hypothetical protein